MPTISSLISRPSLATEPSLNRNGPHRAFSILGLEVKEGTGEQVSRCLFHQTNLRGNEIEAMVCSGRRGLAAKQVILDALGFGQAICQHGFHLELMLAEAQYLSQQEAGEEHPPTRSSLKGEPLLKQVPLTQSQGWRSSRPPPDARLSFWPRWSLVFQITHRKSFCLHIPCMFGGINFPSYLSQSGCQELALIMSAFEQQ